MENLIGLLVFIAIIASRAMSETKKKQGNYREQQKRKNDGPLSGFPDLEQLFGELKRPDFPAVGQGQRAEQTAEEVSFPRAVNEERGGTFSREPGRLAGAGQGNTSTLERGRLARTESNAAPVVLKEGEGSEGTSSPKQYQYLKGMGNEGTPGSEGPRPAEKVVPKPQTPRARQPQFPLPLSGRGLVQGMIMAEILGPPRSRRRQRTVPKSF